MKAKTPKLPESVKNIAINTSLIHEVVVGMLSNKRVSNAKTKTRAEVSGGGKKPWRQKGTGRARVGSNRSPVWRGGGIIFGPNGEQDHSKVISKKKKQAAVIQMVVQRINEDSLKVIDNIELKEPKTRLANEFIKDVFGEIDTRILLLTESSTPELIRSFRNIKNVTIKDWKNINAYNLVYNEKVLFSKDAWGNFLKSKGIE